MSDCADNMSVIPPSNEIDEAKARRKRKEQLPKIDLGKHGRFYIPQSELSEINDKYYRILADLQGAGYVPEELQSYIESAIFASYACEVDKKQSEYQLDCEVELARIKGLSDILTPCSWRNWWWIFKKHRNPARILLDELIGRQAQEYYRKKEDELSILENETEEELAPFVVQIETLLANLPRMRKKKRVIIEQLVSGLTVSYESKEIKIKKLNSELSEERAKVKELTQAAKQEAMQRLITVLNAIKEEKQPRDWEILKLRRELEEKKEDSGPTEAEMNAEDNEQNYDSAEWDEIEYLDESEFEESDEE